MYGQHKICHTRLLVLVSLFSGTRMYIYDPHRITLTLIMRGGGGEALLIKSAQKMVQQGNQKKISTRLKKFGGKYNSNNDSLIF